MPAIFLQGFLLQASLILALGAQNIFVLNAGLRRERHLLVALVSFVSDTLLTFAGVLGVATVFLEFPRLKVGLGVVGVCFLFYYGALKLRDAWRGTEILAEAAVPTTLRKTILTTLGFSLLNPHVYLDTVVLVGGYSAKFATLVERFYFGAGASAFSGVWFFGLCLSAAGASRLLNNPKAMRMISAVSGTVLLALAFKLSVDVFTWMGSDR
ncbi:MAG: amino acid transporter [Proteobacteria bacterium]|nr:MAG: amino acid transporter [Pseudomonadota bacterium]